MKITPSKNVIWIIWLILSILLLTALSACSDKNDQFAIWIGGSPQEVDFWQKVINDFNNETNSNLILVRQPTYTDQRKQSLTISLEGKQTNPDLFLMDVVWISQFTQSGWLEPLNNYADKTKFDTAPFFNRVLNLVDKFDNKLYALPVFMDVALLYYRTDLIDKPPETWEQLKDLSIRIQKEERINNKNFNGFVWQGAQYEGLVCSFLEFIASNGGAILQSDSIKIDSKQNEIALQFMQELIHKNKISPENTYTEMKEEEVRREFQKGNALFERNWTYAWKLHNSEDSNVKGKVGMTILPHFDGHKSVSTLGGWHIGISKYSDKKEKAWKFIQYVTSYKVQKEMVLDIGWNPGRKDVYTDEELNRRLPHLKTLEYVFDNTVARPTVPYYSSISEVIQRNVNNCLANKISPKDALKEMEKGIKEIIKIYGG
ncbi:MAG: ABC transporter substrate-binding protein [Ignavibacteriaceae bacterium]